MAGGKGTLTRETADIRDVHTERKSRVLLIAHTPVSYTHLSVQTKVAIKHADEKRAALIVPANPGNQFHLILELTDNGTPILKSYKRVILNLN